MSDLLQEENAADDHQESAQAARQPTSREVVVIFSIILGIMLLQSLFAGPRGSS